MKKKALSLLLILTLLTGALCLPGMASFSDIPDANTALAAAALESMGIASGMSANTFSPDSALTRAQFCAMAVRAMGLEDQVMTNSYKARFSDAKPGNWYTGYVNLAYSKNIINGYGNGLFGPDDSITYGQVVTILLRMLGYTSADVGMVWPNDYVNYAKDLGISEGLSLSGGSVVTRGQAAILIYNMLGTEIKDGAKDYFETIDGVVSTGKAIILDNDAVNGSASGLLMACEVGAADSSIDYYSQKTSVSEDLVGYLGTLMFNGAGKVIGFMPESEEYTDVTVSSAKSSGITSTAGVTYRITGSAQVIYNGSLYTFSDSGYVMVNSQSGKKVRLYYNDDGAISYIYISSGSTSGTTEAVTAETNSASTELARKLGISNTAYSISKNGAAASPADLAQYDVAYYDGATRTMCVSDYKVTGYIEAASPSVEAAETITVAGCTMNVLSSAWDTLESFSLGNRVTLLLTDDGKVAAAISASTVSGDMLGILSTDGSSVTLCGSGLVLTGDTVSASSNLYGTIVKVSASNTGLSCSAFSASSAMGTVDISASKVGTHDIAPGCEIYEWAGSGTAQSYVYSLDGTQGASSTDFSAINWTDSLSSSYVSYCHINTAGQVDILLLKDVTGNFYEYGKITTYTGTSGINLGIGDMIAYNNAATVSNSKNMPESTKYLCTLTTSSQYAGIALSSYNSLYQRVSATASLTRIANSGAESFYQSDGDWYVVANAYEIPVSDNVQVYIKATNMWYGGNAGVVTALSSGMPLTLYYDRTLTTGSQIRVIVVGAD